MIRIMGLLFKVHEQAMVYLMNMCVFPDFRVRELKDALQSREVQPVDITWRGRNGFAFLRFTDPIEECDNVLTKLEGLTLKDQLVVVERAKDKAEGVGGEEQDGDVGWGGQ